MKYFKTLSILFTVIDLLVVYVCGTMKVIIDTDAGGDDATALLLALSAPEVEIVAITCSYGNTNKSNVERNVLKILTVANRSDIPVFGGAERPLLENYTAPKYYGEDGFGDFDFDREISASVNRTKHASIAMIDLVKQTPGEINILILGPLTNVALAVTLYPEFSRIVKKFYVMGAAINENVEKPNVEWNFSLDPESNAIFLKSSFKEKSLIVPYEVVHKYNNLKKWRMDVLGKLDSEKIRFLNQAEGIHLNSSDTWSAADPITTAMMIRPSIITKSRTYKMSSVECGSLKGEVHVDSESENANVDVAIDFDIEVFKDMLLEHL